MESPCDPGSLVPPALHFLEGHQYQGPAAPWILQKPFPLGLSFPICQMKKEVCGLASSWADGEGLLPSKHLHVRASVLMEEGVLGGWFLVSCPGHPVVPREIS